MKWALAVTIGAIGGALLRAGLQRWLNLSPLTPVGTLLVNIGGAFLMGLVMSLAHKVLPPIVFYGASAGFCGSLTTFSSIMVEIFEMLRLGQVVQAGLYLLVTIVVGLLALIGGYSLGARWA